MISRILIGAPIADFKLYSFDEWAQYLETAYPQLDVLLCVNGRGATQRAEELRTKYPRFGFMALDYDGGERKLDRLYEARQAIQAYAFANNYEALWWLDTDTIPQVDHALGRLLRVMSEKESVVSGVYCYKRSRVPVIMNETGERNATLDELRDAYLRNEVYRSAATGFGCLLVARKEFSVPFNKKYIDDGYSDDFAWYLERATRLHEKSGGMPTVAVVPIVMCKHLGSDVKAESKQ